MADLSKVRNATHSIGIDIYVAHAIVKRDFEEAFAAFRAKDINALVIAGDSLVLRESQSLAVLAVRYALPAIMGARDFPQSGGLIGYGTSLAEAHRQAGLYAGRILKGERPADLPVLQPTKFELVINLKTAKVLGLSVPPTLLAIADEVIE
jgi:putative ABC transport system substrate-binding protein